ncbi:MAG: hypothetical protein PF574_06610 [Candidatus Delongbacteria bacterium]|jgi:hypothetical protein|nr:hypothetical protein [Candidatus Delongbacteria bacterium]
MMIGDKKVVHTASLIIPENEKASFDFSVGNWEINLQVFCKIDKDEAKQGILAVEIIDGIPNMILTNWLNSLGMATIEPVEFGTTDSGNKLYTMISQWYIGGVNKIDIQFLLGGENGINE